MRKEDKVVSLSTATRVERKHAKHVARTEARRVAKCKPNWQKEWKSHMLKQRGADKIMALIGRGIAVQTVKIARGI
ncbi:hypothetical protein AH6C_051 [Aeromonas phage pAh6-C]|uniref:Uncharacterized protein n=1 Tax=Aeromonas phage pAh6-C TaxID=1505227 RepID=A0A076G4F4_9CAUD|nr:hypothetical protein AH6C_051 [Aeromonas phage pAh6-C]AII26805.1 hypothetical protein AH6C_051 [Aeromonas phage pAh6-C]